jgi:hypothetical protein
MTTARKGNTTEAAVLSALVEQDLAVLVPFGEGHPYDLVVHLRANSFLRIQCKTARVQNGCLLFNSRSTDHGRGEGTYLGLADLFGVYCPTTGAVYLVPVHEVPTSVVYLRLEPTRNNQQRGIRFAANYEIGQVSVESLSEMAQRSEDRLLADSVPIS